MFIMDNCNKIKAFDYMLQLFEEWRTLYFQRKGDDVKPLSKLIVIKLLFLTAAPKKDGGEDLLSIFDNFYALPYGPVESDVYNAIQKDLLPSYHIKERSVEKKTHQSYEKLDMDICLKVQKALEDLQAVNYDLIGLSAFELVEITHKWESWNKSMKFAEFMGHSSAKMLTKSIREDSNKCFK